MQDFITLDGEQDRRLENLVNLPSSGPHGVNWYTTKAHAALGTPLHEFLRSQGHMEQTKTVLVFVGERRMARYVIECNRSHVGSQPDVWTVTYTALNG
jgi:hypothetical protein